MNDKQITCFLRVAEYLSFSKAAQSLYLTQPAVTHQISSLEDELGFSLFIRNYRSIALTDAGRHFYEGMTKIDRRINALVGECREIMNDRHRFLTLGHYSPEGDNLFYQAIYAFTSTHPELRTDIRLPKPEELIDHLFAGRLDAIVLPQHILAQREDLQSCRLCSNPEYCIMSRRHPLAGRERIGIEDLSETVCLALNEARCGSRPWHEYQLLKTGRCEVRMQHSLREQLTNLRTQPSVMISLYPMLFVDNDLVRIPFGDGPSVTTVLAWLTGNDKPGLKSLIDFLTAYYMECD